MIPVASKHKRSLNFLCGMDIRDAPHKEVAVIYGPRTYVDRVYGARNGGRPNPSQINTVSVADVVKQHLGFGPAPTFRTSERQDRCHLDPIELKIPKQRKRAHANATSGQTESAAWEDVRKKATQKLKEPVAGRARQTPRRISACFAGSQRFLQPAVQNETTQRDQEIRGGEIEAQRGDTSRHTSIEQDELPQSISEELYEAFTPPASRSAEDLPLAIATDTATSPSNTDGSLSALEPTVPAILTVDGPMESSLRRTSDSKISPLGSSLNGDAPIAYRKRRRRFRSNAITATFHVD
ncbi:hypothetical protein IWX90DRAFT_489035 [Phyllosticta citrichinensis]|uniref:Uncharacterized protein n=1 Tax=Phyllosticta citrichinensis TaxID=1130410 RepID=A0ABR1XL89_9PEZI